NISIRNHARRIDTFIEQTIQPGPLRRLWLAFVTAAQDRDATAAGLERARKFFDDRSFASAADGEVANTDHDATEGALAKNPLPIEIKTKLHDALVEQRQGKENSP